MGGLEQPLPLALKRMVATFALTYIINLQVVKDPNFLTAENLTPEGVEYAKALNFERLVKNSGIHGLGSAPNEVPGSWRPSKATTALVHGLLGLLRFFR